MTQKEKAKAYDETIEKAKALYQVAEHMSGCNVLLETIFPELKESEDEKIRKVLISHFCGIRDNCGKDWYGFNINDVIAWLEKQSTDISSFSEEQQAFMRKYIFLDKITLIKLLAERDANNAEIIESFENIEIK